MKRLQILFTLALISTSCSSPGHNALLRAKALDTKEAYRSYIQLYPRGDGALEAKQRLDQLDKAELENGYLAWRTIVEATKRLLKGMSYQEVEDILNTGKLVLPGHRIERAVSTSFMQIGYITTRKSSFTLKHGAESIKYNFEYDIFTDFEFIQLN